jgi:hypothetical protein
LNRNGAWVSVDRQIPLKLNQLRRSFSTGPSPKVARRGRLPAPLLFFLNLHQLNTLGPAILVDISEPPQRNPPGLLSSRQSVETEGPCARYNTSLELIWKTAHAIAVRQLLTVVAALSKFLEALAHPFGTLQGGKFVEI